MILEIDKVYNEIEEDLIENEDYVFKLRNLYSRKYSKYSDRLNDVNVGLFLDDSYNPVAQIFVRNKTGYIRTHLIFNFEGTRILDIKTLNYIKYDL